MRDSGRELPKVSFSVVYPLYIPTAKHRVMTEKNLWKAKEKTKVDAQWVIVETESQDFIDYADIYIYEPDKTTPNRSINRAFKLCDGDFVIFLANDVSVCDGWIEKMYDCFLAYNDCGMGTLGNNEHNCEEQNKILEQIYFSVCMFPRTEAYFDPNYDNLFDDSDFIMRIYSKGKRCYMNHNGIVHHEPHSTYGRNDLKAKDNVRQQEYFRNKWIRYKDTETYRKLA